MEILQFVDGGLIDNGIQRMSKNIKMGDIIELDVQTKNS